VRTRARAQSRARKRASVACGNALVVATTSMTQ
jgi:hypothetical protein